MKKNKKKLNKKELEILQYAADGYSSAEIAEKLHFTVGSIDNNFKLMMLKTDTVNRTHLACDSIRKGLIQ